ncbi:trafficking protein particle complex subunit 12 [Tanacetum coccineum]
MVCRARMIYGENSGVNVEAWAYSNAQLGDLEGAKSSFDVVEGIVNDEKIHAEMRNLVNRNKALMFMVGKDYVSAVREYQDCIDRDATDVVAINNKGLCLMYLRDSADGIKVLESVLTAALNET